MNQKHLFFDWLPLRLEKGLPGILAQERMKPIGRPLPIILPETARKSAVLVALYPQRNEYKLILIQRSIDGSNHSGQIAFPGGKYEIQDNSLKATALREAQEEIHLQPSLVNIIGELTPIFIPVSNFNVYPYLGICHSLPELKVDNYEVTKLYHFSLNHDFKQKQIRSFFSGLKDFQIKAPAYQFNQDKYIWGATAMILSELEYLWMEYNQSANHPQL